MPFQKKRGFKVPPNLEGSNNNSNYSTRPENKKFPNWFPSETIRRLVGKKCDYYLCKDSGISSDYEVMKKEVSINV